MVEPIFYGGSGGQFLEMADADIVMMLIGFNPTYVHHLLTSLTSP